MNRSSSQNISRPVRTAAIQMRHHLGGMIVIHFNGREAIFYTGQRYRCRVNGVELDCTHAGHVAVGAMAAFAAGASFECEEVGPKKMARPVGLPTIEVQRLEDRPAKALLPRQPPAPLRTTEGAALL